jgi:hypothetical protein
MDEIRKELDDLGTEMNQLAGEVGRIYSSVQDMSKADAIKTDQAIAAMAPMLTRMDSIKKRIALLKKKLDREKFLEDQAILDHCWVYEEGSVYSLHNFLYSESFTADMCGVKKIKHFPNCYNLFFDLSSRNGNQPRKMSGIQLAPHPVAGLLESKISNLMAPAAIIHFDFDGYIKSPERETK